MRRRARQKVIVAYLTFPREKERFNELLDGLWLCGVREYPQLSPLRDVIMQSTEGFGGKTAFEMAKEAFKCPVSQQGVGNYAVRAHGDFDCRKFGLFFSAEGEDVAKNDFF